MPPRYRGPKTEAQGSSTTGPTPTGPKSKGSSSKAKAASNAAARAAQATDSKMPPRQGSELNLSDTTACPSPKDVQDLDDAIKRARSLTFAEKVLTPPTGPEVQQAAADAVRHDLTAGGVSPDSVALHTLATAPNATSPGTPSSPAATTSSTLTPSPPQAPGTTARAAQQVPSPPVSRVGSRWARGAASVLHALADAANDAAEDWDSHVGHPPASPPTTAASTMQRKGSARSGMPGVLEPRAEDKQQAQTGGATLASTGEGSGGSAGGTAKQSGGGVPPVAVPGGPGDAGAVASRSKKKRDKKKNKRNALAAEAAAAGAPSAGGEPPAAPAASSTQDSSPATTPTKQQGEPELSFMMKMPPDIATAALTSPPPSEIARVLMTQAGLPEEQIARVQSATPEAVRLSPATSSAQSTGSTQGTSAAAAKSPTPTSAAAAPALPSLFALSTPMPMGSTQAAVLPAITAASAPLGGPTAATLPSEPVEDVPTGAPAAGSDVVWGVPAAATLVTPSHTESPFQQAGGGFDQPLTLTAPATGNPAIVSHPVTVSPSPSNLLPETSGIPITDLLPPGALTGNANTTAVEQDTEGTPPVTVSVAAVSEDRPATMDVSAIEEAARRQQEQGGLGHLAHTLKDDLADQLVKAGEKAAGLVAVAERAGVPVTSVVPSLCESPTPPSTAVQGLDTTLDTAAAPATLDTASPTLDTTGEAAAPSTLDAVAGGALDMSAPSAEEERLEDILEYAREAVVGAQVVMTDVAVGTVEAVSGLVSGIVLAAQDVFEEARAELSGGGAVESLRDPEGAEGGDGGSGTTTDLGGGSGIGGGGSGGGGGGDIPAGSVASQTVASGVREGDGYSETLSGRLRGVGGSVVERSKEVVDRVKESLSHTGEDVQEYMEAPEEPENPYHVPEEERVPETAEAKGENLSSADTTRAVAIAAPGQLVQEPAQDTASGVGGTAVETATQAVVPGSKRHHGLHVAEMLKHVVHDVGERLGDALVGAVGWVDVPGEVFEQMNSATGPYEASPAEPLPGTTGVSVAPAQPQLTADRALHLPRSAPAATSAATPAASGQDMSPVGTTAPVLQSGDEPREVTSAGDAAVPPPAGEGGEAAAVPRAAGVQQTRAANRAQLATVSLTGEPAGVVMGARDTVGADVQHASKGVQQPEVQQASVSLGRGLFAAMQRAVSGLG